MTVAVNVTELPHRRGVAPGDDETRLVLVESVYSAPCRLYVKLSV